MEHTEAVPATIDQLTVVAPEVDIFLAHAMSMPRTVMYVNAHVFNLASTDTSLMQALKQADMVYCDGAGVQLGAAILKQQMPHRLTSTDWLDRFVETCIRNNRSLFLMGGKRGIAEKAAQRLRNAHSEVNIVGCHHGYFPKGGIENAGVIRIVNQAAPDFLIVGFGSPIQEAWIARNRAALNVPTVWCVGAMMDFVSGSVRRAPLWMRERRLEWLHRLWLNPKGMWPRYLVGNLWFVGRMLRRRWQLETSRSERTQDANRHRLPAA